MRDTHEFDTRTYDVRQAELASSDARVLPIYKAGTAVDRHSAMVELDIGLILSRPGDWRQELLYVGGPWEDLGSRPDLCQIARDTKTGTPYRLVNP